MRIFVMSLAGNTLTFNVNESDTIEMIKSKIELKEGIPVDDQRLICEDIELEDGHSLGNYKIQSESTLQLHIRQTGGMTTVEFNSMKNPETRNFSSTAPKYRTIDRGINFEGTCKNSECDAYMNKAFASKGFGKFIINREHRECYCPLCKSVLQDVKNVSMYCCRWTTFGYLAFSTRQDPIVEPERMTSKEDGYEYFGGDDNIENWEYLEITVNEL